MAALNGSFMRATVSRGCPQAGGLSSLPWCLVADDKDSKAQQGAVYILRVR